MNNGIANMQASGWEVLETETLSGNYGCAKTACFGCLFLPLALLGKKSDQFKVVYKRKKSL